MNLRNGSESRDNIKQHFGGCRSCPGNGDATGSSSGRFQPDATAAFISMMDTVLTKKEVLLFVREIRRRRQTNESWHRRLMGAVKRKTWARYYGFPTLDAFAECIFARWLPWEVETFQRATGEPDLKTYIAHNGGVE